MLCLTPQSSTDVLHSDVPERYIFRGGVDVDTKSTFAQELGVFRTCVSEMDANIVRARDTSVRSALSTTNLEIMFGQTTLAAFATDYHSYIAVDPNDLKTGLCRFVVVGTYHRVIAPPLHLFASLFGSVAGRIKFILMLFTPVHRAIWPPHVYRLNLLTINGCFTIHETVFRICRRLKANELRDMFRSHDFVVFRASLCNVRQFTVLFVMASHFAHAESRRGTETAHADSSRYNDALYISVGGGKRTPTFSLEELQHCLEYSGKDIVPASQLKFISHNHQNVVRALHKNLDDRTYGMVPLSRFVANLTQKDIRSIAKAHGIHVPYKLHKNNLGSLFENHSCPICQTHLSVFILCSVKTKSERSKGWYDKLDAKRKQERQSASKPSEDVKRRKVRKLTDKRRAERDKRPDFPPSPPSAHLKETIIRGWSKDTAPSKFTEG